MNVICAAVTNVDFEQDLSYGLNVIILFIDNFDCSRVGVIIESCAI